MNSSSNALTLSPTRQSSPFPVVQCTMSSPSSSPEASESPVDQLIESMQSLELSSESRALVQICKELGKELKTTKLEVKQKERILKMHLIRKEEETLKLEQKVQQQEREIETLKRLTDERLVENERQQYLQQAQPMVDRVKQGVGVGTIALAVTTFITGWFVTSFKIANPPLVELITGGTACVIYTADQFTEESRKQELEHYESIYRQSHPHASKREVFEQARAALEAKNREQRSQESYSSYVGA